MAVAERFWAKVDQSGECWIWTAGKWSAGYGMFNRAKGHQEGAHRTAYRLTYGEIPDGLLVCHRCDTPACARPDHLFLMTETLPRYDLTLMNPPVVELVDEDCDGIGVKHFQNASPNDLDEYPFEVVAAERCDQCWMYRCACGVER